MAQSHLCLDLPDMMLRDYPCSVNVGYFAGADGEFLDSDKPHGSVLSSTISKVTTLPRIDGTRPTGPGTEALSFRAVIHRQAIRPRHNAT